MLSFQKVIQERHSVRGFTSTSIPDEDLKQILTDAQSAPSNCNTQPWCMIIVRGNKPKELSDVLAEAMREGSFTLDFTFEKNDYPEPYRRRATTQGASYYKSLGVAADVGIYAQTFLLSLEAHGCAGVPQAVLSYFAQPVRKILNVPEEYPLLFGISFGVADRAHPAHDYREGRVPIDDSVVWHE